MYKFLILIALPLLISASEHRGPILSPKAKLSDGNEIPIIGLGTFGIGNDTQVTKVIVNAIEIGYRAIDTAYDYDNEKAIGEGVKKAIASNLVKREDLFITTKVWCTFHHNPIEGLKLSLNDLGLDYADLVLVHWPTGFKKADNASNPRPEKFPRYENGSIIPRLFKKGGYLEAWKGVEEAKRQGLAKSIGVANFNQHQLTRVLQIAQFKPVINQIENNPYFNQQKLVKFCQNLNITVTSYSPLRRGDKELSTEPVIKEIAAKRKRSVGQIALRWNIQRGLTIVPKATKKHHLYENINVFDFNLTFDEMSKILKLEQKEKIIIIPGIQNHPDYPFHPQD